MTLRTDDNAPDSGIVDAAPINTDVFRVGSATTNATLFLDGRVAELVVVSRAVTANEYGNFRTYARAKWAGLP